MASEQSHIIKWVNGPQQFSILSFDESEECNYCWGEASYIVTSFMISSEIWPSPNPDKPMSMGLRCYNRYVSENPRYVMFRALLVVLGADVADLAIQYV